MKVCADAGRTAMKTMIPSDTNNTKGWSVLRALIIPTGCSRGAKIVNTQARRKAMIRCPTCQHDLLEDHGTTEDLDGTIIHWGCLECRDCIIWPENQEEKS